MLEEDTSPPTFLTRGGIKELYDMPSKSKVKGRFYIFQVTSSQVFPTDPKVPRKENSVKVKQEPFVGINLYRLTLSDGVASCRSFVSDQVFTKLVSL
ncbi:hypothetical protein FGO68_gene14241 [Halteria grandinella]|uniref:Uncharacterized protein n=1 Tax=Halteria grandinella TaxID=5974 RepID=A0A8J8NXT1_HALGN|nr:hypothetical protein FGO68_gene14241 [Halteria grandinella]